MVGNYDVCAVSLLGRIHVTPFPTVGLTQFQDSHFLCAHSWTYVHYPKTINFLSTVYRTHDLYDSDRTKNAIYMLCTASTLKNNSFNIHTALKVPFPSFTVPGLSKQQLQLHTRKYLHWHAIYNKLKTLSALSTQHLKALFTLTLNRKHYFPTAVHYT